MVFVTGAAHGKSDASAILLIDGSPQPEPLGLTQSQALTLDMLLDIFEVADNNPPRIKASALALIPKTPPTIIPDNLGLTEEDRQYLEDSVNAVRGDAERTYLPDGKTQDTYFDEDGNPDFMLIYYTPAFPGNRDYIEL